MNLRKLYQNFHTNRSVCLLCIFISFEWSSALVIRVSTRTGHDDLSCLLPRATKPCKTVEFALNATEDDRNRNQTHFTFLIEDHIYRLEKRVHIIQTNPIRRISLQSSHANGSIIRCTNVSAGFEIGVRAGHDNKPGRNINIVNLKFQHCGPRFAAAMIIWNSVNITFRNCVFEHNEQAGINAFDSGVTIDSCLFFNNTSNGHSSSEEFKEGYTSAGGGAGFLFRASVSLSVLIRNSIFTFNSAMTNDSATFIAPSSNVSHFTTGGGGLLAVFLEKANRCNVVIQNTIFLNNSAAFGGGGLFVNSDSTFNNRVLITHSSFLGNRAGQEGGGLAFYQWDNASSITNIVRNCTVTENHSRKGAGMVVFLMNYDERPNASVLRFDTVLFRNNQGDTGTAILLTTTLQYSKTVEVIPEFINSVIEYHKMSFISHSFPFTSQGVSIRFKGKNVFQHNYGGGAAGFRNCVLYVERQMVFANNTGSTGGALFLISSQIILYPGSEVMFLGNTASMDGGAIFASGLGINDLIHEYNPDCFLAYSEHNVPPSKWKANVSFIENVSYIRGAAIFVSSLQGCSWSEEPPYHNLRKALRWSSNFVYRNNSLVVNGILHKCVQNVCDHDIATDTKGFHSTDNSPVKLAPGQVFALNLKGYDELNNDVFTDVFPVQDDGFNLTFRVWPNNPNYILFPEKSNTVPFSYAVSETLYREIQNGRGNQTRKIQFIDFFSSLRNAYTLKLELQKCPPGFKYDIVWKICSCDETIAGIKRCDKQVYLKEGYWADVTADGSLVTYYCPYKYCNCKAEGDLPGCLFDPLDSGAQCSQNREGRLCGKCSGNTSVGLRGYECIDCSNSEWVLPVVISVAVFLCILVIWLNPGMPSELRGPLFFFQILPYVVSPTSRYEGYVFLLAEVFNFGGPLVYLPKTCILEGIDNLYSIAFGYLVPFVTLFLFLLAYLLSANYCFRFRFRRQTMLKSFWLLVVMMYNYLIETTFKILFCRKVGRSQVFFYDGTIKCFQGDHLIIAILAILVLVFLMIPPPIIVFLITNGYWRVDPQFVNTLMSGLRPKCRWWWLVDLCRRVLLVAIYTFVEDWKLKQVLMIFMCVIILAVHSNCRPYLRHYVNLAESVFLLALCTIAILSTLPIKEIIGDDRADQICLVLLVILAFYTLMVFIYKAGRFFRKRFKCACTRARSGAAASRDGYDELEDTEMEWSLDPEIERQRSVMNVIF